jgi:TLC domain
MCHHHHHHHGRWEELRSLAYHNMYTAWAGLVGFGGIVMFFFDWGDIPLLSAKLFKYLSKDPKDMYQWIANRLFELFAVTFFVTRVCCFNFVVTRVIIDLPVNTTNRIVEFLLLTLVGLQTYWMYLIVVAVQRQKKSGGNVEDVREKDE